MSKDDLIFAAKTFLIHKPRDFIYLLEIFYLVYSIFSTETKVTTNQLVNKG